MTFVNDLPGATVGKHWKAAVALMVVLAAADLRADEFKLTPSIPYLYWENDELNSVDQDYSGRVDYQLTPLVSVGANAAVRVDHHPDRDILTTGLVYGDNRRIQQRYGSSLGYQFSERMGVNAAYTYSRKDWRNSTESDLEDDDSHAVSLGLSRELGAAKGITVGLLNGGWAHYDYETLDTDYYFGTVQLQDLERQSQKLQSMSAAFPRNPTL